MPLPSHHHLLAATASIGALVIATTAVAAPLVAFDIKAGSLDAALEAYAAQSGRQLLYSPALVAGRSTPALRGRYTADQALARLLAGTTIAVRSVRPGVIVLESTRAAGNPVAASTPGERQVGLLAIDPFVAQPPSEVEAVVVTGTHIRGPLVLAAPLVVLDREDIDRSGAGTLAEALSALPQNFGGSGTPDTYLTSADGLNSNTALATGVNLRGLGADATLVLVNGRRLAGTGSKGDFADVSAIPLAAIERVDVLLDGASALYGSDAVGGVVNVILRRDFDGAETRARGGVARGGTAEERSLAQTFGWRWDDGGLLVSGEYYRRKSLGRSDRAYTASADLRGFGGTDHRSFLSSPGNILTFDPSTFSFGVGWAIPPGQDGTALTPGDFLAGQTNYGDILGGADLLPEQDRLSLYAHLNFAVTNRIEFQAEARYSERAFAFRNTAPVTAITVTAGNPYFVSPNGSASHFLVYSFLNELGSTRISGASESLGVSAGLNVDLPAGWRGEVYAAYAQENGDSRTSNFLNTAFLNEALGNIPDQPGTAFSAASDGFLNLFGDGSANSRAILDFISSGYSTLANRSEVGSLNLLVDGDLFSLPGGLVKVAVGGQLRRETFAQRGSNFTVSDTRTFYQRPTFERQIRAVFAEVRVPLVGPGNAQPAFERLEVSLAGRIETYDDVGQTADPKVGIVWSPIRGLDLRATYGTSFRAPTLPEVYERNDIGPATLPRGSVDVVSIVLYGGNTDLEPQTATSWSAGFDWAPPKIPDLRISASWFDIDFSGQIGTPALENIDAALTDPDLAPFVTLVNPSVPADRARIEALLNDPAFSSPGLFPVDAYGAIVDARYVNTAQVVVRGLDLSARYRFDLGGDQLDVAASATYMADFERRLTPTARATQLVDRAGQPVDLRARASATWRRGAHETTLGITYVDDYRAETGKPVESWTTVDLNWRWAPIRSSGGLRGLTVGLSIQNLFDADPPFYDSPRGFGYDAANADPYGRVIALQAAKRW